MSLNITTKYGIQHGNSIRHYLPLGEHTVETSGKRRRSFNIVIEGDPDHGDTRKLVVADLIAKESLQHPIEIVTISMSENFLTNSLADEIEAASPSSLYCTELRLLNPGIPHWEKSKIFFPGQSLTSIPTYSRMAIGMDSLLSEGTRRQMTFFSVTGMHNLCHLFVFPPFDPGAFSQHRTTYMDALIILLAALDTLELIHLPPAVLFEPEDIEDISRAFGGQISSPRILYS